MTTPDHGPLDDLAARLGAEDPAFVRQFGAAPAPHNRRRWAIGTALVSVALVVAGAVLGVVQLALLAVPVSITAALIVYGRTLQSALTAARPEATHSGPRRTAGG